jgi:hypothetical protein
VNTGVLARASLYLGSPKELPQDNFSVIAFKTITIIAVVGIPVVSIRRFRKDKKNGFNNN